MNAAAKGSLKGRTAKADSEVRATTVDAEAGSGGEVAPKRRARVSPIRIALAAGFLLTALLGALVWFELTTSTLQARVFSDVAQAQYWSVYSGPSLNIRQAGDGPYDVRLGYRDLPKMINRLTADQGAEVQAQASWSPEMLELFDQGITPIYNEKFRAGLKVLDRDGGIMSESAWPERAYDRFTSIPGVVIASLLFIENRELLAPDDRRSNPTVEWDRLAFAVSQMALRTVDPTRKVPGASTLATQLEKFRHSSEGRTQGTSDKLRQMVSATLRAYRHGEDTGAARRDIVLQYINSVPLGAVAGYGEVQGLGDALWAWFGTDFATANALLSDTLTLPTGHPDIARRGTVFRQVLALFLAQRRPRHYLVDDRNDLARSIDAHLGTLARESRIDAVSYEAAMRAPLVFREKALAQTEPRFFERKAADAVRVHLLGRLGLSRLYDLDRLDLPVRPTFDGPAQMAATRLLTDLRDPAFAEQAGLRVPRLLGRGDPSKVVYSFTVFERDPEHGVNRLRLQTDSFAGPFNLNDGMKLELGSTAKLRTLVTYLEALADVHDRLAKLGIDELARVSVDASDALTQWVIDWLIARRHAPPAERSMVALLEASMERVYSASPAEKFMTGGGLHSFENFDDKDDRQSFTLRGGFHQSVNLVFVRLMRDVVRHLMFQVPGSSARLLADGDDPRRRDYLVRFADVEGRIFQEQFFKKYRGHSPSAAFDLLVQSVKPTPRRLATIYRTVRGDAPLAEFATYLRRFLPDSTLTPEGIAKLYAKYSTDAFGWADKGYLAKVHPLELWTVSYLRHHPGATLAETLTASVDERQEVYSWLFRTSRKNAQDKRIKGLLEVEAFLAIHRGWQRLGYPFPSLVPSYATALGSSGDRPTALAELMGIIQNGGDRLPTERVESLHFAESTPYEAHVQRRDREPLRVMRPEVAEVARRALIGVVEKGTAKRVFKAFERADGEVLTVGGKTGTGDNRRDTFAKGGKKIASTVVSRTATFAFFVGDRFFGVVTAYVPGLEASGYEFTSALPSTLLKLLAPEILPSLMDRDLERPSSTPLAQRTFRHAPRFAPTPDDLAFAFVAVRPPPLPPEQGAPPMPLPVVSDEAPSFPLPREVRLGRGARVRPVRVHSRPAYSGSARVVWREQGRSLEAGDTAQG